MKDERRDYYYGGALTMSLSLPIGPKKKKKVANNYPPYPL
jgi:hypothetical protein